MRRTSLLVALLLIVGILAVPAVGAVVQEERDDGEDDEDDVAPGARLSGVVGVQEAELDGEIEGNALGIALQRADDNATKAGVIAETFEETEARLAQLEERKAELEERRESGEISDGRYRAEMAKLDARTNAAERQLDRSGETAAELPEEALEEKGVNETAIRDLRQNADELAGEEVAEIARSIAGNDRGEAAREDERDRRPAGQLDIAQDRGNDDERPEDAQTRVDDERPNDEASDDEAGDDEDGEAENDNRGGAADDESASNDTAA